MIRSTFVSARRRKFNELLKLADEQPSWWLAGILKEPERPGLGLMPALARLSCLRTLACRHPSDQPYLYRKRLVRQELGI